MNMKRMLAVLSASAIALSSLTLSVFAADPADYDSKTGVTEAELISGVTKVSGANAEVECEKDGTNLVVTVTVTPPKVNGSGNVDDNAAQPANPIQLKLAYGADSKGKVLVNGYTPEAASVLGDDGIYLWVDGNKAFETDAANKTKIYYLWKFEAGVTVDDTNQKWKVGDHQFATSDKDNAASKQKITVNYVKKENTDETSIKAASATVNAYPADYTDKTTSAAKLGAAAATVGADGTVTVTFSEKTEAEIKAIEADSAGRKDILYLNITTDSAADFDTSTFAFTSGYSWDDTNNKDFNVAGKNIKLWLKPFGDGNTVIKYKPTSGSAEQALTIKFAYKAAAQVDPVTPEETTTATAAPSGNGGWVVPDTVPSDDSSSSAAATTEAPAEVVTAANGEAVEAPKDTIPDGAALEVKEKSKEEAVKAVEAIKATDANKTVIETVKKAIEEGKAAVVEISLVKNGAEVQPNGTVKVTLNVPAALKNAAKIYVYRVEADGTFTDVGAELKGGKVTFSTKHFSTYIFTTEPLTGSAVKTEAEASKADQNQNTGVAFVLIPAALAAAGVIASKKRNK